MRNWLVVTTFLLAFSSHAQYNEIGVFGGGTNFLGDVGNQAVSLPQGWVAGISFRHQFDYHYGLRAQASMGTLANNDASSSWVSKQERNLSFQSSIWEVSLMLEINFLEYVTGSKKKNHSPYLFGGLALFGFNPQAQYSDGEWYDLQPLGTEGQGTNLNATGKYGLAGISMPFGMGYRWSVGPSVSIAAEIGFRSTSTDYIDDTGGTYVNSTALAAQSGDVAAYFSDRSLSDTDKTGYARGNDQHNDWYVFSGIHIYFALTPKNERCSGF